MNKLLEDYPDLSHVLINERDIFLTYSLQTAANTFHEFENGNQTLIMSKR